MRGAKWNPCDRPASSRVSLDPPREGALRPLGSLCTSRGFGFGRRVGDSRRFGSPTPPVSDTLTSATSGLPSWTHSPETQPPRVQVEGRGIADLALPLTSSTHEGHAVPLLLGLRPQTRSVASGGSRGGDQVPNGDGASGFNRRRQAVQFVTLRIRSSCSEWYLNEKISPCRFETKS